MMTMHGQPAEHHDVQQVPGGTVTVVSQLLVSYTDCTVDDDGSISDVCHDVC